MSWPSILEFKDRSPSLDSELKPPTEWYNQFSFRLISTMDQLHSYFDEVLAAPIFALDLETSSLNTETGDIAGFSMACSRNEGVYVPLNHKRDKHLNLDQKSVWPLLQDILNKVRVVFFNGKFDVSYLEDNGIVVKPWDDASISCFMVNTNRKRLNLKLLSGLFLGRKMLELEDVLGKGTSKDFTLISPQEGYKYAAGDALNTLELHFVTEPIRAEQAAIYKIEIAAAEAVRVLERNHVLIDVPYCKKMWAYVDQELRAVRAEVFKLAGCSFDIDSPKQCGDLLFETLKIPYQGEKTKSGQYNTEADYLTTLQAQYPICRLILTARSLGKMLSTYVECLIEAGEMDPRGAKFCFFMNRVPTGRMAAGSGDDKGSGYAGINVQSIPATYSAKPISAFHVLDRKGKRVDRPIIPVGRQFLWEDISHDELIGSAEDALNALRASSSPLPSITVPTSSLVNTLVQRSQDQVQKQIEKKEDIRVIAEVDKAAHEFLFEEIPDEQVAHLQQGAEPMPTAEEADAFAKQLDPNAGRPLKAPSTQPKPEDLLSNLSPSIPATPAPSIVDEVVANSAGKAGTAEASGADLGEFLAEKSVTKPDPNTLTVEEFLSSDQIKVPTPKSVTTEQATDALVEELLPPGFKDPSFKNQNLQVL